MLMPQKGTFIRFISSPTVLKRVALVLGKDPKEVKDISMPLPGAEVRERKMHPAFSSPRTASPVRFEILMDLLPSLP